MTTQPPHRSQAGENFLSQVFENADPEVAQFMARHNALLERVTELERALEGIQQYIASDPEEDWVDVVINIDRRCKAALNA